MIDEFLKDPTYNIRGITRNPGSKAAQDLVSKGVEIVAGDLLDLDSLKRAFKVFSLQFNNFQARELTSTVRAQM